ncbi:EAL domain-containing protein [Cupriavidus necator]|uniref:EAL domain-containing protein n=1 Tax=Cupriavidus necator TaxID=106590 RepID=UPI00068F2E76|nr:EAL domain-containing protein [Cupriavidus necator]
MLSEPQRSEVKRAKARGLKLAIDDFGTGYCSLAYFKTFDLDVIKLDQSYVQAGSGDRVSTKVIDVIVEFARALDLTVIAEGVETEDQRARLITKGIRLAQGYLFGRPMALSSLRPWLGERAHGVPVSKVGYGTTNDFRDSAP